MYYFAWNHIGCQERMKVKTQNSIHGKTSTGDCEKICKVAASGVSRVGKSMVARIRAILDSDTRGGSLVEFAVTLPLILVIMTGILTFSLALYQKQELAIAVGTGARFLATDRTDNNPCASAAAKIYAASPSIQQSKLTLTFSLNGTAATGPSCPGPGSAQNANMVAGGNAKVTATYPCVLLVYGLSLGSCQLYEQMTEVVQ
jgi:Flp pilus assembly protein TadG